MLMHERDHEPGHIPPPDLPQHKTVLGFRPHIFIGGLILIAILVIYLFLFYRDSLYAPGQKRPAATSSYSSVPPAPRV
ncbi:MAG: hypothetical protein ABI072_03190 [Edaphobacter sp.]